MGDSKGIKGHLQMVLVEPVLNTYALDMDGFTEKDPQTTCREAAKEAVEKLKEQMR